MTLKNNIKSILEGFGFRKFSPTDELIKQLGVTRHRFFQLVNNEGNHDITVREKNAVEDWLSSITNTPVDIFEDSPEDLKRKHNLIKA